MIKSISYRSRTQVEEHLTPSRDIAIISITDPISSARYRPAKLSPEFGPIIRLTFQNVSEEMLDKPAGAFPDLHLEHEKGIRLIHQGREMCDYNDAWRIANFVERLHLSPCLYELIAHCEAGVSRSFAVAQFVAERYKVPMIMVNQGSEVSLNHRLLRLLHKVANRIEPVLGFIQDDMEYLGARSVSAKTTKKF